MTPKEFATWLRGIQAGAAQLPADFERVASSEVGRVVPVQAGVSVRVTRSERGVSVSLAGRGARAARRRLVPVLRAQGREAVRARMRGSR